MNEHGGVKIHFLWWPSIILSILLTLLLTLALNLFR
jgi:hypothetical protein